VALTEHGVVLPPGVEYARSAAEATETLPPGRGTIVNETNLPDELVQEAVGTYIEEHASMLGVSAGNTFQTYANRTGSLLARSNYRAPTSTIGEIVLARDLAERDDDIAAAIGAMLAVAFGEGMQHTHKDEVVLALFDEVAKHANLDSTFKELYREWLIAGSLTTVHLFTRENFQFQPEGADRNRTRALVAPLIGVLPAEQLRITGNDLFGTGELAYKPALGAQERWLEEFFATDTTAARKAEMRREDPVLAALLVEQLPQKDSDPSAFSVEDEDPAIGNKLYRLNPRMVLRSTMPKGAWRYPRPPLTADFALVEAKRLLNLMDYALLQGGSNFLVVAKKGTDQRPAMPQEVDNLRDVVRRAARSGVLVGDHRLNIEIITPDLQALLNTEKRTLVGRKLANRLLRVPEDYDQAEATKLRVELIQRVITADRLDIRRHVEKVYEEVVSRNPGLTDAARIWFPKIMLAGGQWFTDYVLKMRDRGDISRHSAVAAGGFDYEAEVQARKREKPDDRIMAPAAVPFSSPNAGPQDNQPGRPPGASSNNGRGNAPTSAPARARPRQVIQRNSGETVTARFEEEVGSYRIGELTYAILEEYADSKTIGRLTPFEQAALDAIDAGDYAMRTEGPLTIVPVNGAYDELADVRAVRLATGLSMLVGTRDDDALVARALCFRTPEFDPLEAQETAIRWGYGTEALVDDQTEREAPDSSREEHAAAAGGELAPVFHIHVETTGGKVKRTIVRDKDGNITGSEEEPVDDA
jgi:hypothetical protein